MNPTPAALYEGREQSLIKHFILREYLCEFAHKIGSNWDTINYIDCFSGPWNVRGEALEDSSFRIALDELRKARHTVQGRGRDFHIRCLFLEKKRSAYTQLEAFAKSVKNADVQSANMAFEQAVPTIQTFIRAGGRRSFTFLFIDPTGMTGLALPTITPLLRTDSCEVLINFMTKFIRRFVHMPNEELAGSFDEFFGRPGVRDQVVAKPTTQEREDELFLTYAKQVRSAGEYPYGSSAIILQPSVEWSHFHLIYATRSLAGVEVFKTVERKAMDRMAEVRGQLKECRQIGRTGQPSLFTPAQVSRAGRLDGLRSRYARQAREAAEARLQSSAAVLYDELWGEALTLPLVSETDIKCWIQDWQAAGKLTFQGFLPKQRVPHLGKNNLLVWDKQGVAQSEMFGCG